MKCSPRISSESTNQCDNWEGIQQWSAFITNGQSKDVCTLSNSSIYLIKKNTSIAYKNCDKSKFLSYSALDCIWVIASPVFSSNSILCCWLPTSYMEQRDCILLYCLPTCYVVFLVTLFLQNFLLKSPLGCGSLDPHNMTSPLQYLYMNICWKDISK
jgi:hypothetical protein